MSVDPGSINTVMAIRQRCKNIIQLSIYNAAVVGVESILVVVSSGSVNMVGGSVSILVDGASELAVSVLPSVVPSTRGFASPAAEAFPSSCSSCLRSTLISDAFIAFSGALSPPEVPSSVSPATASSRASFVLPRFSISSYIVKKSQSSYVERAVAETDFNGASCDQSHYLHIPFLSYSISTIRCLKVIVWVEILIEDDHHACCSQIDAHAPCFGREQEHWYALVICEFVDQRLTLVDGS